MINDLLEIMGADLLKETAPSVDSMGWGLFEHVLHLLGAEIDERLIKALKVAGEWRQGNISVGEARSFIRCNCGGKRIFKPDCNCRARSVGHAVATAHMVDHSLGAAWYALKTVKNAGKSIDAERRWQDEQLPSEIKELVLTARKADRFKNI